MAGRRAGSGEPPPSPTLDEVILQRGSTRLMDRGATVPRDVLRRGRWPPRCAGSTCRTSSPCTASTASSPALYRWPDLDAPRARRRPARRAAAASAGTRTLGRDAAFVVIGAADLDALDDRGYRDAQLAAGLVEGRLHLAAYALGLGASGMTFLDSRSPALLGEPLAGAAVHLRRRPGVPLQAGRPARGSRRR